MCSACFARERRSVEHAANVVEIAAAVTAVEPALAAGVLAEAICGAAPGLRESGRLVRALRAEPDALISGGSVAPAVVDRLVEALQAASGTHVRLPTCVACGSSTWLSRRHGGNRICAPCAGAYHVELCVGCGRSRPVGGRRPDGAATCRGCSLRDRSRRTRCDRCGKLGAIVRRLPDGTGLCQPCSRPVITCADCGRQARCYGGIRAGHPRCSVCVRLRVDCARCGKPGVAATARLPDGPVCSTCWERALLAKATCDGCGRLRRPDPRHPGDAPRCSDCAGLAALQVCGDCGDESRNYEENRCRRCVLRRRVDKLLAGPDGTIPIELVPLADTLAATEPAKTGLRWIATPKTADLLRALASGRLAATHAALDEQGDPKVIGHLRSVLVSAGVLAPRDENLACFEAWIAEQVAAIDVAEDRHIVDTYATWWVLRRYRQRAQGQHTEDTSSGRSNIVTAATLLAWLRAHERSLADATQADINLWAVTVSGSRRRAGHDFLRWATKQRLVEDLAITRRPEPLPTAHPDPAIAERTELARRLLNDDEVPLSDRVAGLLVVLYAQAVSDIVLLTASDVTVTGDTVSIRLGRDPIELAEPFSTLVTRLASHRAGRAAVAADPGGWLFPGGRPGRHLQPERLRLRLRAQGLRARTWRTNALLDLASDTPLVVLADLLGLHTRTASRWVQAAGGGWTNYAADRIRSVK